MPNNVITFPVKPRSVEALVAQSEAAHRAQDGNRQTLREILTQLADSLQGEAQALSDNPGDVSSVIRNLAHNVGYLRSIIR